MRGQRSRKPIGFRLWVVHILDDKEEVESAKTKANSNETKSTAESVETSGEDVELQIGEIDSDVYTNKMF